MRSVMVVLCACIVSLWQGVDAWGGTFFFPATPYKSATDKPVGFVSDFLEDFEDDTISGFTVNTGGILQPRSMSGIDEPVTDSVDGDDGVIDGSGLDGHSFFAQGQSITITFDAVVASAALVWTDGDIGLTNVRLEAFDAAMTSLGFMDYGDLSDGVYTGTTDEDRFLGVTDDMTGIKSLRITNQGLGAGIEIDHVQWSQEASVPEPACLSLALVGLIGIVGLARRR